MYINIMAYILFYYVVKNLYSIHILIKTANISKIKSNNLFIFYRYFKGIAVSGKLQNNHIL